MNPADIIPSSNVLSVPSFRGKSLKSSMLESAYSPAGGFIGAFLDRDDQPDWVRRVARYHRDEFMALPGRIKRFGDVKMAAAGAGECFMNGRHALELWIAGGRVGPEPFAREQDYGSCVGMSFAEHMTAILGWRAARPEYGEVYKVPTSCYPYAGRGYCSDGWDGWGCMTTALKFGLAFQMAYSAGGSGQVDLITDDQDEQVMARAWCRTGPPQWFLKTTQTDHPFEDGAITEFNGGVEELRTLLASGGCLQTGGTVTSGGPKPFSYGPVGPHMQSVIGGDDSDQFRQFCRDVLKVTPRDNDFPCVFSQTWGAGWKGECADQYWPTWWGPKPQGAWLMWASDVLRYFRGDMFAYLPRVKGFAGVTPPQPPVSQHPPITGELYVDGTAIRGTVTLTVPAGEFRYVAAPSGGGRYKLVPKPEL